MNTTVDDLIKLKVFSPENVPTPFLLAILAGIALIVGLIIFFHYRSIRLKKEYAFQEEMKILEMDDKESNALADIVRRYALNEPVEILYSLPLFDKMVEKEMERVLSTPLSSDVKKRYVDLLYLIRQKTYFPEEYRAHVTASNRQEGELPSLFTEENNNDRSSPDCY